MMSSFTIEFPLHLAKEKREYCLNQLRNDEGAVVELDQNRFRIDCDKPKTINEVGWTLYHTAVANYCRVIETDGEAEPRAKSYVAPNKWGWKRK